MPVAADFFSEPVPWIRTERPAGAAQVVLSAAIAYRNLKGVPFGAEWPEDRAEEIHRAFTRRGLSRLFEPATAGREVGDALRERFILGFPGHLSREFPPGEVRRIPRILAGESGSHRNWVLIGGGSEQVTAVRVCEGWEEEPAWTRANQSLDELLSNLPWSQSGSAFLTADPRKAGEAVRLAALVHLPMSTRGIRFQQLMGSLSAMGLSASTSANFSAGSGLLWLHSRETWDWSRRRIIKSFLQRLESCLDVERELEQTAYRRESSRMEDGIFRAYHQLLGARLLSFAEFLDLSSQVRLGKYLGLMDGSAVFKLDTLLATAGRGHLALVREKGSEATEAERRALLVRTRLAASPS